MLREPAPFPFPGAPAFLKPDAEPCRILRRHDDGTALICLTGRRFPREIASGNPTVPLADLFETAEEAFHPPVAPVGRRGSAATARGTFPPAVPGAVAAPQRKRPARRTAR